MSNVLALGGLAALLAAASAATLQSPPAQDPAKTPAAAAPKPDDAPADTPVSDEPERSPEEKAVLAVALEFIKAYNSGDAKAIASLFVENGEIVVENETPIRGREAIQATFETVFAEEPGTSIDLFDTSVRLLTPDLAVEEGVAITTPPDTEEGPGEPTSSRYTVHYVKQGGKWFQASVHDFPDREPTIEERLAQLDWMIGEWVDEGRDGVVETICSWDPSGKFILRDFTAKLDGMESISGTERIGWDPLTKQIKSWMFDSEGGHGEALWTRSGEEWILKAKGVLADGTVASATRVITMVNKDMIKFRSFDRVAGGSTRPSVEEITLVRKPPAPIAEVVEDPPAEEAPQPETTPKPEATPKPVDAPAPK
ncbi:MAG: SgcJ/EcaC family oxidoreductase [Isosphaeraceae bacterium]|nr:SgcJ/EcaC family oxidoreductase [Isosphaeraceae bacterium]